MQIARLLAAASLAHSDEPDGLRAGDALAIERPAGDVRHRSDTYFIADPGPVCTHQPALPRADLAHIERTGFNSIVSGLASRRPGSPFDGLRRSEAGPERQHDCPAHRQSDLEGPLPGRRPARPDPASKGPGQPASRAAKGLACSYPKRCCAWHFRAPRSASS